MKSSWLGNLSSSHRISELVACANMCWGETFHSKWELKFPVLKMHLLAQVQIVRNFSWSFVVVVFAVVVVVVLDSQCVFPWVFLSLSLALAHHWNFVDMCKCITFPMYAFGIQLERWRWGAKLGNQIGLNRNDFLIMDFTWLIFIHVHLLLRNLSQLFLSFSFSRCLCLYGSFSFSAFSILLFALYIWQLVFLQALLATLVNIDMHVGKPLFRSNTINDDK